MNLMAPGRLDAVRKKFLADRNRRFAEVQPRLRLLRRRLLKVGGEEVVLNLEPQLEEILARSVVWRRIRPRKVRGRVNACHENVARVYWKQPERYRIVTGWVLHGDDVVWRQHSWLLRDEVLVETTPEAAKIYYGVVLDEKESARFVRSQLGRQAGALARRGR